MTKKTIRGKSGRPRNHRADSLQWSGSDHQTATINFVANAQLAVGVPQPWYISQMR